MTRISPSNLRCSDVRDHASSRSILSSPALNAALLCVFLGAVDLTVIAAILPRMITDIGVNTSDIDRYIWIVSGYLIAYIVAIPIVGRISDLAGRKYTFLVSLGIFLIGSIVCGLAQSLDGLIVGRSIQGFGGGGLLPVALALTGDTLPRGRRLAGIGVVSAVDTLGWVIGPVYGAVVEFLASGTSESWRWVFWINVPLLLIAAGFVLLKFPAESPGRSLAALRRLDVPGAILLATMLVAVNLALSAGGEIGSATGSGLRALGGTANPLARHVPALLVLTLFALAGLIVWERRSSHPILPVSLLANRTFALISLANFLVGAVLMVGMVDVPVVVALVSDPKRTSDISAGMLACYTTGIMLMSLSSASLSRRLGTQRVLLGGLLLATLGYGLLYPLLDGDRIALMIPGLIIAGCGLGLLIAPLTAIALDEAADADHGAAASTALVCRLLGMTLGISALTALAVKRLQTLTNRLEPVARQPDEATAAFLLRQQQFLENHAIPLSIQVVQETFLIAAAIALVATIPVLLISRRDQRRP